MDMQPRWPRCRQPMPKPAPKPSGTTFQNVSYEQFKAEAAVFFRSTHDRRALTWEQAENGNKTLGLLYLGQDPSWQPHERHSAVIILEMATQRVLEVAMAGGIPEAEVTV